MTTSTSLNLRALLKTAIARGGLDTPAHTISGLTPAAQALLVAGAAHALPHGVVLHIVPGDGDLERAAADIRFFMSALDGLSEVAADRMILPFPSHEVDPYRALAPHVGVASARARALHAIASGAARIVVASASALLPRVTPPARLLASSLDLRPGDDIAPADLADRLADAGFVREDPADEHGEFALRGGILDVFPAGEAQPVRLEFVGDTIESIRRYDPATQRSVASVDRIMIVPLSDQLTAGLKTRATSETPTEAPAGRATRATSEAPTEAPAGRETRATPEAMSWVARPGVAKPEVARPGVAKSEVAQDFSPAIDDRPAIRDSPAIRDGSATLFDYLAEAGDVRIIISERDEVEAAATKLAAQLHHSYEEAVGRGEPALPPAEVFVGWDEIELRLVQATHLSQLAVTGRAPIDQPAPGAERPPFGPGGEREIRCQPTVELNGRVADWVAEIRTLRGRGDATLFVAATPGRAERTIELLKEYDILAIPVERAEDARYAAVLVAIGGLSRGFGLRDAGLQIYAESDVFEEERRTPERRRSASKAFLSDLRDLKAGDLVVHVDHGIGVFVGLKQIGVGTDAVQEFLELRYAGDDKLFVPVERLDLVQKYSGATRPPVDRLGGTSWERAKTRVKKAMRDMAEELLKLYAARTAVPGHAFSPDSHWQREFEDAFEYELTPDQRSAVADIKHDMESAIPMDRLLCGDVGYGKTEVAMRAAFKAVMDGKQVAFLAPTTVLAFQHQKTLKERFAGFPVRIEMISRFRSKAEQKEALADLGAGKVDCIVGTHRLLSKDVAFRDLGLLVVDEEQRFGVSHKEKIKQLRKKIDVLTMTATPIPRTLNMSLVGIRDMSIIETPPKDRLSIQTNVVKFDQQVIARAIRNELDRTGQVYVVHNRVESIFSIGNLLQRIVPEARVAIAHGQMREDALERAMLDFVARKFDVLLATTIVENGLDIPNANTIIINRADRYGLSQLYQLRGRVGRSDRPAYAYLLIPPEDSLSPVAKKRLAAIKEFSDLGSGFRVAALDLEIRGAGNLLGGEQSGHIEAIGFEMYMKLLEQTVRELKGEESEDGARATVNLGVDLRIDERYVPDMNQRLMLYRKVAAARREDEIDLVLEEAADRFGPLPDSLRNLADYGRIRVMADRLGIEAIDREGRAVVLKFRVQATLDPVRLVALVRQRPDLSLIPPAGLRLSLDGPGGRGMEAGKKGPGGQRPAPSSPRATPSPQRPGPSAQRGAAPSWWTARAKAGEVRPGFTKAEILKPAKDDPRASRGVLEQIGGLLSDLLDQG